VTRPTAALAVLAATVALIVTGCGSEQPTAVVTAAGTDGPPSCPPPDASPEGDLRAAIDWVDFARVDGRMYGRYGDTTATVDPSLIGPVRGRVLCTISEVVSNPDFEVRDGDASFLPAGTELHSFSDALPALRLAVQVGGTWRVYETMDVPHPRTGADLLDLGTGVTSVELRDADTAERVMTSVDDPESVRRLVAAVLAAPVIANPPDDLGSPVFIRFMLADGTWVQRPWNRDGGVLAQRIEAPAELELLFPPG
jgi:hypothetical protein